MSKKKKVWLGIWLAIIATAACAVSVKPPFRTKSVTIGTSLTPSENIKSHRGASGLQFLPGDDATAEGVDSTAESRLVLTGETFKAPLFEDLSKGTFVKITDDGGTSKLRNVLESTVLANAFDSTTAADTPGDLSVSYAGTPGTYFISYRKSGVSNHLYGQVVQYNGGTPSYGVATVIEAGVSQWSCAVYNEAANNIVLAYEVSTAISVKTLTVSGTTITVHDGSTVAINPSSTPDCDYNSKLGIGVFIYPSDVGDSSKSKLFGVNSDSNIVTIGSVTALTAGSADAVGITYSKIYDSVLLTMREVSSLRYHLYRMTDLNTHVLLDTDATSVKNVFYNVTAEDLAGGGIAHAFKSFTDANALLYRSVDVSGDTVVLGSTSTLSTTSPTMRHTLVFNGQLGKITSTYDNSSGNRVQNTATATLTTTTFGTSEATTLGLDAIVDSSKIPTKQSVHCGKNASNNFNILCDFKGGDQDLDLTGNIGLLVSPAGLAGSTGTALLYGGSTKAITGTIGAPIFVNPYTGIFTETVVATPSRGYFLDTGNLFIVKRELQATGASFGTVKAALNFHDGAASSIPDGTPLIPANTAMDSFTITSPGKYLLSIRLSTYNLQSNAASVNWVAGRLYVSGVQKCDAAQALINIAANVEYVTSSCSRILDLVAGDVVLLNAAAQITSIITVWDWNLTISPVPLGTGN